MLVREKKNGKKSGIVQMIGLGLLLVISFCIACQPNQAILNSQNKSETAISPTNANFAPQASAYEGDLKSMETANFDFIYVFRRKDGGKLTAEDKKFAKTNSPFGTNRFIVSDEERAIIAGSNTKFTPINLEALRSGFDVADFSKPESELKNANANANTSMNK